MTKRRVAKELVDTSGTPGPLQYKRLPPEVHTLLSQVAQNLGVEVEVLYEKLRDEHGVNDTEQLKEVLFKAMEKEEADVPEPAVGLDVEDVDHTYSPDTDQLINQVRVEDPGVYDELALNLPEPDAVSSETLKPIVILIQDLSELEGMLPIVGAVKARSSRSHRAAQLILTAIKHISEGRRKHAAARVLRAAKLIHASNDNEMELQDLLDRLREEDEAAYMQVTMAIPSHVWEDDEADWWTDVYPVFKQDILEALGEEIPE